ncbi:hypothetical protein Tco_0658078 [Tanacetum coccineum]
MEECHKLLTNQIDLVNPEGYRIVPDISNQFPFGGPPGQDNLRWDGDGDWNYLVQRYQVNTECSVTTCTCYEVMKTHKGVKSCPPKLESVFFSSQVHKMDDPLQDNVKEVVIVCHEKVVWISLEGDEILRVQGERTQGVAKTLLNTKFCIDLVPGATPVVKSPYRLAPSEMQEWLNTQELQRQRLWEDIMRACVINFCGSYHSIIRCAPFEALYGRKCRSPVLWAKIREGSLIRLELVQKTTDKVVVIKEKLKAARDRQKSYANNRRKPLEFKVGDRVILKVSHWKGTFWEEVSGVMTHFTWSFLKNGVLVDASLHVPLDEIKVDKTLRFVEEPVEIMDREVKSLKRSRIPLEKVCWNSKRGPEFTWEREDYIKSKYPQFFVDRADELAS